MKKIFAVLIAIILCIGAYGVAEEKPTIAATTFPLYDIAKNVAGDKMNVVYVPENAQENVQEYDILFVLNESTDPWTTEIEGKTVVYALEGIETIDGENDVFTAPINVMLCASYFSDALCALDPANSVVYQENFVQYFTLMSEIDSQYRSALQPGMNVFSRDGSLVYLAIEYGVNVWDTKDAYILATYNFPTEEDAILSYAELMMRNIEVLTSK